MDYILPVFIYKSYSLNVEYKSFISEFAFRIQNVAYFENVGIINWSGQDRLTRLFRGKVSGNPRVNPMSLYFGETTCALNAAENKADVTKKLFLKLHANQFFSFLQHC